MKLEFLAEILEGAGLGSTGESLFMHAMPDVEEGIMLRLPLEGVKRSQELRGWRRHGLQVIVRGLVIQEVLDKADAVIEALTIVQERTVGPMEFRHLHATMEPILYPRSEASSVVEASINFDCCYALP